MPATAVTPSWAARYFLAGSRVCVRGPLFASARDPLAGAALSSWAVVPSLCSPRSFGARGHTGPGLQRRGGEVTARNPACSALLKQLLTLWAAPQLPSRCGPRTVPRTCCCSRCCFGGGPGLQGPGPGSGGPGGAEGQTHQLACAPATHGVSPSASAARLYPVTVSVASPHIKNPEGERDGQRVGATLQTRQRGFREEGAGPGKTEVTLPWSG